MKKLSTIAAAMLLASGAQAAVVMSTDNGVFQNTEINQTRTLSVFDSSLGTLTGISLAVIGDIQGTIRLDLGPTQNDDEFVMGTTTSNMFLTSNIAGLNALFPATFPTIPGEITLSYSYSDTLLPSTSSTSGTLSATGSFNPVIGAGLFAALSGGPADTFTIGCRTLSGLNIVGGSGFAGGGQTTQARCSAEITYTYDLPHTPMPEPGSMALVGLALAGLGLARRRKA